MNISKEYFGNIQILSKSIVNEDASATTGSGLMGRESGDRLDQVRIYVIIDFTKFAGASGQAMPREVLFTFEFRSVPKIVFGDP